MAVSGGGKSCWRGAATDAACGRADPTAPARPAAEPRDRARAALDWECSAAARADCRSFPLRNARTRRARDAERDQAQVIEIPGIEAWGTGGYRRTQADRQRFPSSAGLRGERGRTYGFIIRSHQVPQLGHAARIQIG
jgi:hypothetical protein